MITGTAVPGATLKITKDFNLYTAPVLQNTTPARPFTPPQAIPTHLESSMTVPASGKFTWDVNPSVRPRPAYRRRRRHAGPNGFLQESWTITCTAADGTLLETNQVTVDKGQTRQHVALHAGRRRRHGAGHAVADARRARRRSARSRRASRKDYTASTTANVISTAGDATLSRRRPVRDRHRPPGQRHVLAAARAAGAGRRRRLRASAARRADAADLLRPVSNDPVTITFKQHIGATDALRTGTYAKTLTFTLSTTTP